MPLPDYLGATNRIFLRCYILLDKCYRWTGLFLLSSVSMHLRKIVPLVASGQWTRVIESKHLAKLVRILSAALKMIYYPPQIHFLLTPNRGILLFVINRHIVRKKQAMHT